MQVTQRNVDETELMGGFMIEERHKMHASILYHVLPTMVQTRMPTLPSFRRSLNGLRNRGLHGKSQSTPDISRPVTPPPGYSTRPGSGHASPERRASTTQGSMFDTLDDMAEGSSASVAASPAPMFTAYESRSGVNWQFARHGTGSPTRQAFVFLTNCRCKYGGASAPVCQRCQPR